MDIKTQISTISELRVAEEFIRNGNSVFTQINGKAPFDLVVYVENKICRVSVKSVLKRNKYGSYPVQLRSIRSNKSVNKINLFDSTSCDILAIYFHDINKIMFIWSKYVTQKNTIKVKENDILKYSLKNLWRVSGWIKDLS